MAKRSFEFFNRDMRRRNNELKRSIKSDLPHLVGEMLVEGFKESFDLQKFNDNGEQQWEQVKRRMPSSSWYGFQYGASSKGRKNFSSSATTRNILIGYGSVQLRESIFLKSASRGRIVIASPLPYAELHNEGGAMKVFGRAGYNMPKRQFMGTSKKLNNRAKKIIDKRITNIMNS